MSEERFYLPGFSEIDGVYLDLARRYDIERIGILSRELVEVGLADWVWNPEKVARQIHNPDSLVLVARINGKLVAFAVANYGNPTTDLMLLGVSREFQRLGIGSRLVKVLERSAVATGHSFIQLEVRASNTIAQTFYKRLGYKEISVIPRYYSNRESAVRMKHRLSFETANFRSSP